MATTATDMRRDRQSLLALLHLSSPGLPIGAFAYSQGLEYALDCGWCSNATEVQSWIECNLKTGLGQLDMPIYRRMYHAWQNRSESELQHWNQTLLAFRESRELYDEDVQVGSAFAQWHLGQDSGRQAELSLCPTPTVVSMHALASILGYIPIEQALLGFTWSWCENQVASVSKAMPMGQTDGQRILQAMLPVIEAAVQGSAALRDDQIGSGLVGMAIASSLHECQYSRLFRS